MPARPSTAPQIPLPSRVDLDVVLLPREVSVEGTGLYDGSVITLAKELRGEGITADFAHPSDRRHWIGERSATAVGIAFIVGIASNAGWAGLKALLSRGHRDHRVKGRVARCTQLPDEIRWEWFEVEGTGEDVAKALEALTPPEDTSAGSR